MVAPIHVDRSMGDSKHKHPARGRVSVLPDPIRQRLSFAAGTLVVGAQSGGGPMRGLTLAR